MANVDAPFGLRPTRHLAGGVIRANWYKGAAADGYTTTIFFGDPVKWSSGRIVRAAAGDTILGVFAGCQYEDPTTGAQNVVFRSFYDGNAASVNVDFLVYDDPMLVFEIQCTTGQTPAITDRGSYADMITYAAGSTTTGNSIIELGALSGTVATFRMLDMVHRPANSFAEHVVVEVIVHEHAYNNPAAS